MSGPDPFYKSLRWQRLRKARLMRDLFMCVVPGCGQLAVIVDHIKSRRSGGGDTLENLRSLCREHDNAVKEDRDGKRRSGGVMRVRGCFPDGSPRDPNHPWYRQGGVQSSKRTRAGTGGGTRKHTY
jgi:5-methylcytosine-specific restriction endonuclease McrA